MSLCGIAFTKAEFSVAELEPVPLPDELASLGLDDGTAWKLAAYGLTTRAVIVAFGSANEGLTKAGLTKEQEQDVAKALAGKAAKKAAKETVKETIRETARETVTEEAKK